MRPHEPFAEAFIDAILAESEPFLAHLASPVDERARRFAVYRNNVAHSLGQALAGRFPVIERLVGVEYFAALARAYRAVEPPPGPVLHEWGVGFADFLRGFEPLRLLPYLADVARIEYARGVAYNAADVAAVEVERLMHAASAGLDFGLRLHPSVQVLRADWAAVSIWRANQPGAAPGEIDAAQPEIALILRQPDGSVPVERIDGAEADFLEVLLRGDRLQEAALQRDPTEILARLIGAGAITDILVGDRP